MSTARPQALVYACSGYSSAAQLANQLALELDREVMAEMSCIAGVGGGVPALVATARSGRPIIALDGCPLRCVVACLDRQGVKPTLQVTLSDFGVEKRRHSTASPEVVKDVRKKLLERILEADF